MNFDITGIGNLTMVDRDTGEEFDLGECEPLTLEQEISAVEDPPRKIGGFTRFGTATFEAETIIDKEKFNEILGIDKVANPEFQMEWEQRILINARWHKKARIRKKWLKRYGYKEDTIKGITKCRAGEYNTETGESSFDIEWMQYIFKPHHFRRGLHIIGV